MAGKGHVEEVHDFVVTIDNREMSDPGLQNVFIIACFRQVSCAVLRIAHRIMLALVVVQAVEPAIQRLPVLWSFGTQ